MYGERVVMTAVPAFMMTNGTFASVAIGAVAIASAATTKILVLESSSFLLLERRILTERPSPAEGAGELHDALSLPVRKAVAGEGGRRRDFTQDAGHRRALADDDLASRERQLDKVAVALGNDAHKARPARRRGGRIVGDDVGGGKAQRVHPLAPPEI